MIPRHLAPLLKTAAAQYPLSVTDARQFGKTTLVRATFPAYDYVSLEAPDHRAVIHRGGYPRLQEGGLDPHDWLRNYYQTYLERDLQEVTHVGDLEAFARFARLCAGRCGQLLNLVALANDCGISHTTANAGSRSWRAVSSSFC